MSTARQRRAEDEGRAREPGDPSGAWWTRTLVGDWLPTLSVSDPRLRRILGAYGWNDDAMD